MFNFQGVTHVLDCPNGRFTWVGSVPSTLCDARTPTTADVMAGRVAPDGKAYRPRAYDTAAAALADARQSEGVTLCASVTCACRRVFSGVE